MRYLLAFLAVSACSGDPGTVEISEEPSPIVTVAPVDRVPLTHEIPGPPVAVLEAPPEPGAPVISDGCLPGYHEPRSKACCLLDVIPAGSCKCTEYDAAGKITVVGEQCADSCGLNSDGVAEIHTFCVPGGLVADKVIP